MNELLSVIRKNSNSILCALITVILSILSFALISRHNNLLIVWDFVILLGIVYYFYKILFKNQ